MKQGTLLDVYTNNSENESNIELVFKDDKNNIFKLIDNKFKPYFYIILKDQKDFTALEQEKDKYKIIKTEFADKLKNANQVTKFVKTNLDKEDIQKNKYIILKLYFTNIADLISCRQNIKDEIYVHGKFEYDIPFDIRYLLDKNIKPLYKYKINEKTFEFQELDKDDDYNSLAIDIETLSCDTKDLGNKPIVLISMYSPEQNIKKVISYKTPETELNYLTVVKDEKELLLEFIKTLKDSNTQFLITYNGDNFDLPYIKKRAKILKISSELDEVLSYLPHTLSNNTVCYTKGIQHIDAYKIVSYLDHIGAINLNHLTLNDVYKFLFNKSKIDLPYKDMQKYYDNTKLLHQFIEYNLVDSIAAYEIANNFLEQFIQLSQMCAKPLQDTIRSSSSNLVESLLMKESVLNNKIIPNKPKEDVSRIRETQSYEGGYVKEPTPGLHENICVLDFQSFHPSIIITFNISPESLNKSNCKKEEHIFETDKFCQDVSATIPAVLSNILEKRVLTKDQMKKHPKDSIEYKNLYAQQWSLKILLNSMYGYLAYSRARWYCYECARSTLKYTHKYIHFVINEAEKYNMKTIYSDTDSAFLIYKNKENIFKVLDYINKALPGKIHLSLDNFYKRGIFVEKKQNDGAAKKRYALIEENGNVKITGFETVRRDWSNIAKNTQKEVLETILKTGDINKAAEIVKKTIKDLKERNVKPEDLIIMNKIRKDIEGYSATGPHVAAALKARTQGYTFEGGELIEYIITSTGKTISDKAQLAELVKEGDYDIDYYINNQVLPSVITIFNVFNYDENKLLSEPSQKKLF